ncbi:ABC transporter ATP-binding protein [Dactylosporangium sp. CA-233914]|uniref:ABC transporter ATP-binding protein n=1 Tax=Dactylosporangium sp. CA-233914 TaxID=3239934 RepID=UPI003D94DBC0
MNKTPISGQIAPETTDETVLDVRELTTELQTRDGVLRAVDNVSFTVRAGEVVGVVGESGCGKSMTAQSVLGLLPPSGKIVAGSVKLAGRELVGLKPAELRRARLRGLAVVFQDPMTSLNPVHKVGAQVAEAARIHLGLSRQDAKRAALEALERVHIPSAARRFNDYPHQLSGGMRQRVVIAMAMVTQPKVLIADEPTTALDVTTEAKILDGLEELRSATNMGVLLVTHDIGMISSRADRLVVMYAGRIVEQGVTAEVIARPRHPYTAALIESVLTPETPHRSILPAISGSPPDLRRRFTACRFAERCGRVEDRCRDGDPALVPIENEQRWVACVRPLSGSQNPATVLKDSTHA